MRNLERWFPSITAMERSAARRIPRFAFGYMQGGIDREVLYEQVLVREHRGLSTVVGAALWG